MCNTSRPGGQHEWRALCETGQGGVNDQGRGIVTVWDGKKS